MKKQKWTVVFDLDGSLETPYFKKEDSRKIRAWMEKHPCGYSFDRLYAEVMDGLPHYRQDRTFISRSISAAC